MSVEIREYREFKRKHPSRRTIPLFRILLVLVIVGALYHYDVFHSLYFKLFPTVLPAKTSVIPHAVSWNVWCESHHGKPFLLKSGIGQCSWIIGRATPQIPDYPLLHYLIADTSLHYPFKLHWMGRVQNFETPSLLGFQADSVDRWFFHVPLGDSSFVWLTDKGCRFPGPCPRNPLEGGVLPISEDFDFEGREALLMKDQFMGIGESPVSPIMAGRVMSVFKGTQGYTVEVDHGGNLMARYSGLSSLGAGIVAGASVNTFTIMARLAPKDSATFNLEVIRNGKFVRWNEFFTQAHPIPDTVFATFRRELGF
jgi:hypothetical protein